MQMDSNMNIVPNAAPTLGVMESVNNERKQIQQIELAERMRQKEVFEDLIRKSYKSVAQSYYPEYKNLQDQFIGDVSKVWENSDGFLSVDDHMKIEASKKPMEDFVMTANENKKIYTKLLTTIQYDESDKINKEVSRGRLMEAMEITDVFEQNKALNGISEIGQILEYNPEDINLTALTKAWVGNATRNDLKSEYLGKNAAGEDMYRGKIFDQLKWNTQVETYWKDHERNLKKLGYTKNTFAEKVELTRPVTETYKSKINKEQEAINKKLVGVAWKGDVLDMRGYNEGKGITLKGIEIDGANVSEVTVLEANPTKNTVKVQFPKEWEGKTYDSVDMDPIIMYLIGGKGAQREDKIESSVVEISLDKIKHILEAKGIPFKKDEKDSKADGSWDVDI